MLKKGIYITSSILFMLALFIQSIDWVSFDLSFFHSEYQKLSIAESIGTSEDDLMIVTAHLLDYIQDEQEDLIVYALIDGEERTFFNEREIDHMVDVKILYQNVINFKLIAYLLFGSVLIYALIKKEFDILAVNYIKALFVLASGLIALILLALIDFDQVWTAFHLIFFSNDLWLLNPATDLLIRMVPLQFFYDLVFKITSIYLVMLGGFTLIAYRMKGK
ncbi:MAG: TIGR01906 family membrane protein [Erysipelotrichaceae bacterium]